MASFTSSATSSTWPRRMCACGHGLCIVKISRSTKNPGRPYFACPCPMVSAQFITGHNCMNIKNPLTNSFIICTHQPCGLVGAQNEGKRARTMRNPQTTL
ncbi:hypothetical protein CsSME_00037251 [Camellia sinensis var. sinensis]